LTQTESWSARRILCIQATGVASESAFSDAGRFRGNLRSGLDKLRLRTLTLLNRWGRVRVTETTMPAIPLLWSCLSENDKQAIYNGATLAELDASLVEAVALAEREALDDAKRDGRVKKPTRASSARTRSTRRRGRRRKEKRRRRTVASLAPFLRRSATRTTRTMTTNMQHLFT